LDKEGTKKRCVSVFWGGDASPQPNVLSLLIHKDARKILASLRKRLSVTEPVDEEGTRRWK